MASDTHQPNAYLSASDIRQHNARILSYLQKSQYLEAEKLCDWLLAQLSHQEPHHLSRFEPTFYLGVALQFQGKVSHALEAFKNALSLKPNHIDVMQAIASCQEQLGQFDASLNTLLNANQLFPNNANILANLGAISEKRNRGQDALNYYNQALTLSPKNYTALMNKGALLGNLGFKLQALAHCELAYQTHPETIGTLYNLVDALLGVFKYDDALALADIGLAKAPQHANLLFKKGLILSAMARYEEAQTCLANAQVLDSKVLVNVMPSLAHFSDYLQAYISPHTLYLDAMYHAQSKCCWHQRNDYLQVMQTLTDNPALKIMYLNYELAFQCLSLNVNGQQRLKISQSVAKAVQEMDWLMAPPVFSYQPKRSKKLRIGYVSANFRQHPTGILSRQLYGLHDKSTFEIYGYSIYKIEQDDDVSLSIKNGCTVFKDVSMLSDVEIAKEINEDNIDILVNLNGYTADSRNNIFAMRPAPLQVLYLAYLHTMGAEFMDYTLLDAVVAPARLVSDWQETIVRLPNSLYLYDNETNNQNAGYKRQDFGLPDHQFVFCCLSTNYKIEPDIFAIWMHILKEVPDSVLWLLGADELTQFHLVSQAEHFGIEGKRLIFGKRMAHKQHLLRYQLADLFIDTFWYGAHTTALDALWQGLPVLCCIGEVSTARVAASFLETLNMPELITTNFEAYAKKAIEIANNPDLLKALKEKLAFEKDHSPLFNTENTVRHIEKAYELMWQNYCDGNPPIAIDVTDNALQ